MTQRESMNKPLPHLRPPKVTIKHVKNIYNDDLKSVKDKGTLEKVSEPATADQDSSKFKNKSINFTDKIEITDQQTTFSNEVNLLKRFANTQGHLDLRHTVKSLHGIGEKQYVRNEYGQGVASHHFLIKNSFHSGSNAKTRNRGLAKQKVASQQQFQMNSADDLTGGPGPGADINISETYYNRDAIVVHDKAPSIFQNTRSQTAMQNQKRSPYFQKLKWSMQSQQKIKSQQNFIDYLLKVNSKLQGVSEMCNRAPDEKYAPDFNSTISHDKSMDRENLNFQSKTNFYKSTANLMLMESNTSPKIENCHNDELKLRIAELEAEVDELKKGVVSQRPDNTLFQLKKEMKKFKEHLHQQEYKMAKEKNVKHDAFEDMRMVIEKTIKIPELSMVLDIIYQNLLSKFKEHQKKEEFQLGQMQDRLNDQYNLNDQQKEKIADLQAKLDFEQKSLERFLQKMGKSKLME